MSLKNLNTDNLQIFNKALAPDNVPEELLKYGADVIAPVLCEMLQMQNGKIPGEWKEVVIITIFKKAVLSSCSNWRGITLLNSIKKVLASTQYYVTSKMDADLSAHALTILTQHYN